jgi:hypothetical protein
MIGKLLAIQEVFEEEFQLKQAKLEAEKKFQSHPNLQQFHQRLLMGLEEFFMGCKTVASGVVETSLSGSLGTAATTLNVINSLTQFIPAVGCLGNVLGAVSSLLQNVDATRQTNILKRISHLGTFEQLQAIVYKTAKTVTENYEFQLKKLPSKVLSPSFLTKVNQEVLKEEKCTAAQEVGDFAVELILGFLLDCEFTDDLLDEQFLTTLMTPQSDLDKIVSIIKEKLGLREINLGEEGSWTLHGFFTLPGIEFEGNRYSSKKVKPQLYGYRKGTKKDIEMLNLELEAPVKRKPAVAPLPSQPAVQPPSSSIGSLQPLTSAPSSVDKIEFQELKKKLTEAEEARKKNEEEAKKRDEDVKQLLEGHKRLAEVNLQLQKQFDKLKNSLTDSDSSEDISVGNAVQVKNQKSSQSQTGKQSERNQLEQKLADYNSRLMTVEQIISPNVELKEVRKREEARQKEEEMREQLFARSEQGDELR